MLDYHTNARNGALVRFNPAVRSNPTPRLASPRCPPARFQARTILPSPPSRLPPHHASFRTPPPSSAQHHARFPSPFASPPSTVPGSAVLLPSPPSPSSISRPRPRLRFPPFWASRCGPSAAPTVCGFACRFAPRPPRSAPRRRPRLISGSARVSRLSICARRPHLLSAEPSAGPRSPRLVPVRLPLDSVGPVSSRTSPV